MTAITTGRAQPAQTPQRQAIKLRESSLTPNIDPIRVLRRHMFSLIVSIVIGGVLGVVTHFGCLFIYPLYSGEVLFELQPGLQDPTQIGVSDITRDDLIERLARTQTILLVSREVLERAMENPEITRSTIWHEKFDGPEGVFDIQEAVDELEEDLRAPVIRGTNLFALRWSAHEKNDVPIVLNAVKTAYVNKRKALDETNIADNMRVFNNQLLETDASLRDINSRIQQFIIEHALTSTEDPRFGPVAQALSEIIEKSTDARENLNISTSNLGQIQLKLGGTLDPSPEDRQLAEQHPRVIPLISYADARRAKRRELYERYQPGHAEILNIEKEVRAIEQELESAITDMIQQNLESSRKLTENDIETLEFSLDQFEEEHEAKDALLRELTADYSEYTAMETERRQLEEGRLGHTQMINELKLMRLRADANRVRVAQDALPPREPSFPKPEIVIPLGVLLTFGLTLAWIFVAELTDQRVKSASDLSVIHGSKVLGSIPDLQDDPTRCKSADLVVQEHPESVLAESYRQAATAIAHEIENNGYQSAMVLSAMPGSGTSTVVTNLAIIFAAMGKRVCVIDADFRRPRLAKVFGVDADQPGFGDLLGDQATLDEVTVEVANKVKFIPAGTPTQRIIERLSSSRMSAILAELRSQCDLVLFDTPPALVAGDAMAIANRVDSALLVVRANREQRGLVARLVNQFAASQCNLLGMLLNRPLSSAGGYFKKNYAAMAKYGLDEAD